MRARQRRPVGDGRPKDAGEPPADSLGQRLKVALQSVVAGDLHDGSSVA